jgi:membrane protein required for colicin V production|tara:strand:+ start:53 stop:589 length:537 start_codon:yes stop_codon:yes gene_type:complete
MNYLDIALVIPLVYGVVKGFSRGIVKEVTSLVSLIIGVYIALNFSFYLEVHIEKIIKDYKALTPIISFTIVFVSTLLVIKAIGNIIEKITNALALGVISKLTGAIFGCLKVAVLLSLLIFFEQRIEIIPKEVTKSSILKPPIEKILVLIIPKITEHQEFIKEIEKKAKKATKKIKKEL